MHRRLVWVGVVVFITALSAQAQSATDAARKLLEAGKFADAAKAIDAALAQPSPDEATTVALYELAGIAQAQLKQAQKARVTFQKVFALEPGRKLAGKWPPKVTAAFNEAKKSMAKAGPALAVEQLTPEIKGGQVIAVYLSVENDVLHLGRKTRVHLRQDSGSWTVQEVPVGATMKADVTGKTIEWWVELLGERGELLAHLASQDKPLLDAAPGAPAPKKDGPPATTKTGKTGTPVADKKPELTPKPKAAPPEVVAPGGPPAKVKILPWALVGAGVVAGGVGIAFGAKAQGERGQITGARPNADGVVTSITRSNAIRLDADARTDSIVANSLMAAGIGLAVTGGVLWFLGRE